MKITLKRTPEQIELIKAMASKNRAVASEAQTALAEFIGPVLAEVINNAPTLSNLFTVFQFNKDDILAFLSTSTMISLLKIISLFTVRALLVVFPRTKCSQL